jgi:RNA polymerase sigma-B factor
VKDAVSGNERNIVSRSILAEDRLSEPELWRRRAEGDRWARERLVERYLPLVRRLARRYAGVREPYDDLLQVASLGLLQAIDRFDPAAGTPFAGFAKPTILGELKRHLRDKVWTVRIPRPLHDRIGEIEQAVEAIATDGGRSPSVTAIADWLGLDPTEVLEALEADHDRRMVSLDAPAAEDEGAAPRVETLGGEDAGFAGVEDRATVAAALRRLDQPGRELLRMRFGEELSQGQIGARLGRSQMYVSRRLREALAGLREATDAAPSAGTPGP